MSGSSKPTESQWFSLTQDHKIFAPMARLQKPSLQRAPTLAQRLAQLSENASQCQLRPNRTVAWQTGRAHPQYPFVSSRSRGDYYARLIRDQGCDRRSTLRECQLLPRTLFGSIFFNTRGYDSTCQNRGEQAIILSEVEIVTAL
jgi:hypothetical protein